MTQTTQESVKGDWLSAKGTQEVMALLEAAGHQVYAVGGCVRNAFLGEPVSDVDLSTDARPERVMALAEEAGLKVVPTGLDHGTVTVVADGEGYEVTTFRADVETDGRRAVVRFADDMAEDAIRRDFTMNALYADRFGRLVDPLGGLPDLKARRLRFIEDPDRRIQEDFLRILRFFRFFAWYGDPADGMDPEALAGIAANVEGLATLSRERVGVEIVKLLSAPDPLMPVSVMAQTGVLAQVLPGAQVTAFGPLLALEAEVGLAPAPMRRLAGLGFFDGAALRLSKAATARLRTCEDMLGATQSGGEIAYRHGLDVARDVALIRAASLPETDIPEAFAQIAIGAQATFPVGARDLMPDLSGPALGTALKQIESDWIASGFILDKATLLKRYSQG